MTKLLVYGTLRRGHHNHKAMGLADASKYERTVRVSRFSLHDIGWFPGVVPNQDGTGVVCELYTITDHNIFRYLDQYEGYDPRSLRESLYVRKNVLLDDGTEAQIYVYNKPINDHPEIVSGDWNDVRHCA